VSESVNANGFEMELEAERPIYFLQKVFQGVAKWRTSLSRNSLGLVRYLMQGTYFAAWSREQ
jgi:hypothetical protein